MRALAIQGDANAIPSREDGAYLCADLPRRVRQHVLAECDIGLGDAVAQSALDHRLRAAGDLFRGLKQRDEGSAPRLPSLGEQLRRAQQTRDMRIMAASMRDSDFVPRVINRGHRRSVGQPGLFLYGKRVHVSSREYGLTSAVPQDPN